MMQRLKTIGAVSMLFVFVAFSANAWAEDDDMSRLLRSSVYGGIIGALLGSAVLLLTDNPDDHLSYIPRGAALGIIAGTAYGLASNSGIIRSSSAAEIKDGRLTLNMPTIQKEISFDENTNTKEVIEKIDLVKVSF